MATAEASSRLSAAVISELVVTLGTEAEVRAELDCLLNLRRQRRIFTPKQRSLTPAERRAARERLTGSDAKLNVKLYA